MLAFIVLIVFACKREYSYEGGNRDKAPVANAGSDTIIVLPVDSITLNGNKSYDPDNNISSYQWSKVGGPSSFIIRNANAVTTAVSSLVTGVYQFELKVTDAAGLFDRDTVKITVDTLLSNNVPPVAVPGNDTLINSPQSSCATTPLTLTLNGSRSYDPDGNIVSYLWSGPGTIANPNAAITTVSGSFLGPTSYSLKVTDNKGAVDTKYITFTISIGNRPVVPVTATLIGTLSTPRMEVATVAAGNKIFFAGGYNSTMSNWWGDSRVDIYNISSNAWSTAQLSVARHGITAVAAGNKVFFAGGHISFYGDVDIGESATVDIYDLTTNTWSVASLSQPRGYISSATVGNKVFFAGGYWIEGPWTHRASNVVDIYDISTNTWSTTNLSEARTGISAVAVNNNKVFFGGGSYWSQNSGYNLDSRQLSDKIDIYDLGANSWTVSNLSEPKIEMGGIAANNKIYWAGGQGVQTQICKVEVRDVVTQSTSFDNLSFPKTAETAFLKNNRILFINFWQPFDLLDLNTNTWFIGSIPIKRQEAGVIYANNKIYIAGGWAGETQSATNQVWTIDF